MMKASEQHGAVSVEQMRERGLSWRAQRTAIAKSQLIMVEPTVAVVVGSPDTWYRRLHVGLLALGPEAWVSHEAAAALLGLDKALFEPIDFTVPRGLNRRLSVGRVHTTAHVGHLDVITVDGLRCSSATRTILDLAYLGIAPYRLAAAIDSALRAQRSAFPVLGRRLAGLRGPGRYGVRVLDRLMPDTGGETPLERAFLRVLRLGNLPRPTTQHRVVGPNGFIGRVDFIFDAQRMVVEVTGRKGHASDAERQRDAQRRNELLDQGLRVYEYTRSDVEDRPDWVTRTMRQRLNASGWAASLPASPQIAQTRDLT
jgi:very-short-patch-repair endonuclease